MGGGGGESHASYTTLKPCKKLKPYALCLLSILCIHWGIASYQPFIDTALILLCGGVIAIIIDNEGALKTSIYKSRFIIASVFLGAITYWFVDIALKLLGKIPKELYNNKMVEFSDLLEHIILAIKLGFSNLVSYDVAFMPLFMTVLFAMFLATFFCFLYKSRLTLGVKLIVLILLCSAIVASQTHIILSAFIAISVEVDYYGLHFLHILIIALAFKICVDFAINKKLAHNLFFIILFVLIGLSIVQSLYAQKVQKLAIETELRIFNRIVYRIEQNENFSYDKKYCGIAIGEMPNVRERYYKDGNADKYNSSGALIKGIYIESWSVGMALATFMPKDIFKGCFYSSFDKYYGVKDEYYSAIKPLLQKLHKAGVLDTLEPWPHKNSVIVFEDIIVFVASKGNLDEIRQKAKEWRKE